jgi:hypothetical protein
MFERKVYRRILGPVYENKIENWRILTNKEIYAIVKKPTITERNGRSSWEWQGIVAFCTCQWNEWINEWMNECTFGFIFQYLYELTFIRCVCITEHGR